MRVPVTLLLAALALAPEAGARCQGRHWVGAWAASPSDAVNPGFVDQTLRLILTPTAGGRVVRVRLSNRFGTLPVTFAAASIARRATGAGLVRGSTRTLHFSGKRWVTVRQGQEALSDPVRFRLRAFRDVAVSVHVAGASGPATEHEFALQTSYASPKATGDLTTDPRGTAFPLQLASRPYLTDVDVWAPQRIGALVTVGDSITDGIGGASDRNERYPDFLARRLAAAGRTLTVLNAGTGGTGIATDSFFGPSALHRVRADVIDQAGMRVAILLYGTNDIDGTASKTDAVITGLREIVDELHAAGLAVLLGTQTPARDTPFSLHGQPETIAARNRINEWIRTSGVADGVVDFHAALRDPVDPDRLRPEYDSGDHLHPNARGYEAMAFAVDLTLLPEAACARGAKR